jgi:hypothetical protein
MTGIWGMRGQVAAAAVLVAVLVASVMVPASQSRADLAPADPFVVGAATRSIAPTDAQLAAGVYLGGFGFGPSPSRRATGSVEDTSARALVIGHGGQRVVVVTLDLVGMGNLWMRAVRDGIAAATGISARAVMVHVSHSHASLDMQGLWGGVPLSYRNRVVDQSVAAAVAAVADLGPAELRVASVAAADLHNNRRGEPQRDDVLSVMQFTRPGGAVVSTLVNFGAHPTVIGANNNRIGTDFVGPVRNALEQQLGGQGLFINGTLGDLSPRSPGGANDLARAQALGVAIADRAVTALGSATPIDPGMAVAVKSATFTLGDGSLLLLPVSNPAAAKVLGIDLPAYYDFSQAGTSYRVSATVTVLRLGTPERFVGIAATPGEPLSNLGTGSLRPLLGGEAQFIFATTNDSLGYLIPSTEWRPLDTPDPPGRYEETISLERLAGDKVVAAVAEAVGSLSSIPLADFTDVPGGASFDQGVDWLAANGITTGAGGPRRYSPATPVNRAQMALFMWRMMGRPAPLDSPCGFTDMVGRPADQVDATCWLKQEGVTTGINAGQTLYGPDRVVNREQMAGFLWRLASLVPGPTNCGFTDAPANATFATGACWLKANGITTGTNAAGTQYSPAQNVTRGQMAAFLFRLASTRPAWDRPLPPTALFPIG